MDDLDRGRQASPRLLHRSGCPVTEIQDRAGEQHECRPTQLLPLAWSFLNYAKATKPKAFDNYCSVDAFKCKGQQWMAHCDEKGSS